MFFPKKMPDSAKIESYYYYQKDTVFDPTCQIYLEYSLSKDDFEAEVLRLSEIVEEFELEQYKDIVNNIVYDTENFEYPAYTTIFNNDHCYEYALINNEENKIVCVFTQFIEPTEVVFNETYLPNNFGDFSDGGGFNIYYTDENNGYFERHLDL